MNLITLMFLIVAMICFVLAAFNLVANTRVNWIGLGLAAWVASVLLPGLLSLN